MVGLIRSQFKATGWISNASLLLGVSAAAQKTTASILPTVPGGVTCSSRKSALNRDFEIRSLQSVAELEPWLDLVAPILELIIVVK